MAHKKKNERGQGLVEYLIIVALMAIATMGIMRVMSQTVSAKFARITDSLQGKSSNISIQTETISEDLYRKKDMGDFFNGSKSGKDAGE